LLGLILVSGSTGLEEVCQIKMWQIVTTVPTVQKDLKKILKAQLEEELNRSKDHEQQIRTSANNNNNETVTLSAILRSKLSVLESVKLIHKGRVSSLLFQLTVFGRSWFIRQTSVAGTS
jgi:hypothetical protein